MFDDERALVLGVLLEEILSWVRTLPGSQRARPAAVAKLKLPSAHAVDAFVVATALQFDTAVIATGDPDDIRRLAAPFRRIAIFAL